MERKNRLLFAGTVFDRMLCSVRQRHITVILLITALVFNGCAALEEAQQRREKRILEERDANSLMLRASNPTIKFGPDAIHSASDHYTLTFADDLLGHASFDEVAKRETFARSALSYMESLYDAMHRLFGFKPKHKIHVTLHDIYQGTRLAASTTTNYRYGFQNGRHVKFVNGIRMNFPLTMYERHGVRAHELTHAFTNIYFLPVWFSEGIAVLIQTEYAKGGTHPKFDSLKGEYLRVDLDGVNQLENWGGHLDGGPLTQWRYSYAYTLVAELRKRYGNDFYIKVFQLMETDALHQRLEGKMRTSFLVYYLSKAAGEDLVPFFEDLQFKVRRLTKEDILKQIDALNSQIGGKRE